jgi:selenide,water dikinase
VVTTDFFTPVVDDAYDYGAIAAANALSDVYAMGGAPFLALNIAALPPNLPNEISVQIFRGGADKAKEAGVVLAGGHTIQDQEPKYGLIVIGFVHPDKMLTKSGARPGDRLILTKPLGYGTITTALKQGKAEPKHVKEAVSWMKRLNRAASELATFTGLKAATDITGFSLLGHSVEMAEASNVRMRYYFNKIPFLASARHYANEWFFPGGTSDNRLFFASQVVFDPQIDEASQMLMFDAQTSGGLLLSVPESKVSEFYEKGHELFQPLWEVGEVVEGEGIEVLP